MSSTHGRRPARTDLSSRAGDIEPTKGDVFDACQMQRRIQTDLALLVLIEEAGRGI